jgi:pimeloyl-ACP methyl ester carboxylesterase
MSGLRETRETFEAENTTGGDTPHPVRVPGSPLYAEAQPTRRSGLPPALFVHGLGGSTRNWETLMSELSDTVDGHAVDLPGFGQSPPPDDADLSLDGHVRAVVDHLERGGRGPVHLFGNSLGGAVATRLAATRPDLVRSLTLISPALPEVPPQTSAWPTGLLALPGATSVIRRATRGATFESRTQALLELCYGDPGSIPPERRAVMIADYRRRAELPYALDVLSRSARGIIRAYIARGEHSLWRQAERVTAPTLLVYGLKDKLVGYRMARRASQAFADSRLMVLPQAGHVAMMEFPALVAARVREFLAEVERAKR